MHSFFPINFDGNFLKIDSCIWKLEYRSLIHYTLDKEEIAQHESSRSKGDFKSLKARCTKWTHQK